MSIKIIKWSDDKWLSRQGNLLAFDKLEHLIIGIFVIIISISAGLMPLQSLIMWEVIAIMYEVFIDGPRSGVSIKDWVADNVGFGIGFAIVAIL